MQYFGEGSPPTINLTCNATTLPAHLNANTLLRSYPDRVVKPSTSTSHKVLVIGDSLALGLGAWPLPGSNSGVAPHLLRCAGLDRARIRQYWTVVNRGGGGTCTEDWMPPGKEEVRRHT